MTVLTLRWVEVLVALGLGPMLAYEYHQWHLRGSLFAFTLTSLVTVFAVKLLLQKKVGVKRMECD